MTFSIYALAQSNFIDVVYLKNGNVLRGKIIEQEVGKYLKIQLDERNILLFNSDEIIEIAKEVVVDHDEPDTSEQTIEKNFPRGYQGIIEIGYIATAHGLDNGLLKAQMINGIRFKRLSLGLGAGIRYDVGSRFRPYIPVFLDIRTRFVPRRVSPFVALGCGYTFYPNYEGGLYLSPSLGISFKLGSKFGIHMALSYELLGYRPRYMDLDDGYLGISLGLIL
jgi:hypothetical protein